MTPANDPAFVLIDISTPEGQATGLDQNSLGSGLFLATVFEERIDRVIGKLGSIDAQGKFLLERGDGTAVGPTSEASGNSFAGEKQRGKTKIASGWTSGRAPPATADSEPSPNERPEESESPMVKNGSKIH